MNKPPITEYILDNGKVRILPDEAIQLVKHGSTIDLRTAILIAQRFSETVPHDTEAVLLLHATLFTAGRIVGIRQERARRRTRQ